MSDIIAVIGSGYGDEGKGLMTDYYASKLENPIVVRSNGGAQAGHTVTTPDGKRHVFSHISSGSFVDATTYLSEFFVVNPMLFKKEIKAFETLHGQAPKIFCHPDAIVTTPYDMLLNQRFETDRGDDNHGSVGVGFGETIERSWTHSTITFKELAYWEANGVMCNLYHMLNRIRTEYVPSKVDLSKVHPDYIKILEDDQLVENMVADVKLMLQYIKEYDYLLLEGSPLIFEAAQGLQLDQDYGYFPYVTRSNCGMRNIRSILDYLGGERDITVNYVTRAYTTRHGAGPLSREDREIVNNHNIIDNTNMENDWQGRLRFAPLNLDVFNSITDKDFLNYAPRGSKKVTTVTCLDQLNGYSRLIQDRLTRYISADSARERAHEKFDFGSYGPTREDVVDFSEKG